MSRKWIWCVFFGTAAALFARDVQVLVLKPVRRHVLSEQGFVLKRDMPVRIKATGAEYRDEAVAYAWILAKENRELVWNMAESDTKRGMKSFDRTFDGDVRLPRGEYELYFAVAPYNVWKYGNRRSTGFWEGLFGGDDSWSRWERESSQLGVELWADETDQGDLESVPVVETEKAMVKLAPLGDDESEQEHISLNRDMQVRIYAVGEGVDGEMTDYGWIVREDTGDEMWTMEYDDTRWAGGAEKNRMVDKTINLPAGEYTVSFVTDDSHSYREWNSLPPYDPRHWGLTLWPVDAAAEKQSILRPKKVEQEEDVIIKMTRIGDDRLEQQGFTLTRPTKVRITCLGELGHDKYFVDYGWILNAKTRETVWEMTRANTKHAGGAVKNRMFNGVVTLDAGSYEVYYLTDDSHAYRDWNAGSPRDPESWGITIRAADEGFDPKTVQPYREENDQDLLAELIRITDDEDLEKTFILPEASGVRVYAIGEGRDDKMFDYGWITDTKGRKVWRMRYADTRHAGGAMKNRMVNETVQLSAGTYTLHFRTDDSHAYEDWNDDPPRDPAHWGISVSRVR